MEVIWTQLAKITYREVLENLKKRWTKKQLKDFRNLTNELLEKIKSEQVVHPFANKKLGIRKGILHKNVSLFYRESKKENNMHLITFFNNRMNPEVLKTLLKK